VTSLDEFRWLEAALKRELVKRGDFEELFEAAIEAALHEPLDFGENLG
jgi:hypothetical protein